MTDQIDIGAAQKICIDIIYEQCYSDIILITLISYPIYKSIKAFLLSIKKHLSNFGIIPGRVKKVQKQEPILLLSLPLVSLNLNYKTRTK